MPPVVTNISDTLSNVTETYGQSTQPIGATQTAVTSQEDLKRTIIRVVILLLILGVIAGLAFSTK